MNPSENVRLVSNLSFSIGAGEHVGIVGRTGAGKTSLCNGIVSLLDQIDGEIIVNGVAVRNDSAFERNRITVIP